MSDTVTVALIAVGGTALGAFAGIFSSYLSKKQEYKYAIRRMLAERLFPAYEELIECIQQTSAKEETTINGKCYHTIILLSSSRMFSIWHTAFTKAWFTKRYLLDTVSIQKIHEIHQHLALFVNDYPQMLKNQPDYSLEESMLVKYSLEFSPLLEDAYKSLQDYLINKIQEN